MDSDIDLTDSKPLKGSCLIGKVLTPALRLWLRSQVEHIEQLEIGIQASDRQILSGHIQQVNLSAEQAVYQGLHLSQIKVIGQNIRMNLGQVVRGKPLQLLEPIAIALTGLLQEADLNASMESPLLKAGVKEFLVTLLKSSGDEVEPDLDLQKFQVRFEESQVVLAATLISASGMENAIALRSGFEMARPDCLRLVNPQWLPHANAKRGLAIEDLNGYEFNLGEDTQIEELKFEVGQIRCQAKLLVRP
jgi:LmeA-like phospholipid-binding